MTSIGVESQTQVVKSKSEHRETRSTRNNNPINLKHDAASALKYRIIPESQDEDGFAIYETVENGFIAACEHVFDPERMNMSIFDALGTLSIESLIKSDNVSEFKNKIFTMSGLDGSLKMSELTAPQRAELILSISQVESFHGNTETLNQIIKQEDD
eukprot:TRINITY_DN8337_c0_g1_i1.p1 TRINITY_DN8337_c0_g1~~TRINITY_DN8337_c0_g1_i1.p1  ORF type:complete len:157 (-),score=24.83 TRINITY_DN8337_c0_g1_i1:46-516(-)